MDLKALWDAIGTDGQAALGGAIAGPVLSIIQQLLTLSKLKFPGLNLTSSTCAKRAASIILACIPLAITATQTRDWQPVALAGVVAWLAGQATHKATKAKAAKAGTPAA
jgi:hypothetical protein